MDDFATAASDLEGKSIWEVNVEHNIEEEGVGVTNRVCVEM